MLALDRPTKSVVVAIRGTESVADLATDMLADPEPMEEWLPRKMKTTVSAQSTLQYRPSTNCICSTVNSHYNNCLGPQFSGPYNEYV